MFKKLLLFFMLCGVRRGYASSTSNKKFPRNFKFGVASSSYQIEGAWNEDGKSENIWDHICHTDPTFIENEDNGDVACDSYHKYKDDVKILKELGVDFYRLSLSWSRILPKALAGSSVNAAGVRYYRNLIQELLDNEIEPLVTIYHFDLPQVLQDLGGWPNSQLADHYAYFAQVAFEELGDLVKYWITFNEGRIMCQFGYGSGVIAPAVNRSGVADYACAHTLIKAHAKAYHIYDEKFRASQKGVIGMTLEIMWSEPASDSVQDKEAAERALQFRVGQFANPLVEGNYPQIMIDRIAMRSKQQGYKISRLPTFTPEEIEYNKGTYDFFGINMYTAEYAKEKEEADITEISVDTDMNVDVFSDDAWEEAASGLKVVPWAMRKIVNWFWKTYNHPEIFITENGYSDKGGQDDDKRIDFHRDHLSSLLEAVLHDGVNVTKYAVWSLMDNFEWMEGYTLKFGLYSVDFKDPERPRTAKSSAAYYKQVIATRSLVEK